MSAAVKRELWKICVDGKTLPALVEWRRASEKRAYGA